MAAWTMNSSQDKPGFCVRASRYRSRNTSSETFFRKVRINLRMIGSIGFAFIDLKDLFPDTKYCKDGVHPQREGARMLEEAIYSRIDWQRTV